MDVKTANNGNIRARSKGKRRPIIYNFGSGFKESPCVVPILGELLQHLYIRPSPQPSLIPGHPSHPHPGPLPGGEGAI